MFIPAQLVTSGGAMLRAIIKGEVDVFFGTVVMEGLPGKLIGWLLGFWGDITLFFIGNTCATDQVSKNHCAHQSNRIPVIFCLHTLTSLLGYAKIDFAKEIAASTSVYPEKTAS